MGDPSEIRSGPLEPASHRFDQQGKSRTTPHATGLAKRQHPLDSATALFAAHSLAGGDMYPTNPRCDSDSGDIIGADLSSATSGCRMARFAAIVILASLWIRSCDPRRIWLKVGLP